MKIVHTESSLGWGGQELRILAESQGLARRGHELTLLCPLEARIYAEAPSWGLRTVALPIATKRVDGLLALRRWLKTNPCDVLSTHSSTDSWLAAIALLALNRPCPMVRTRHISAPLNSRYPTINILKLVSDSIRVRWLSGAGSGGF